jgi:uncharacterized protein (TIGR03435 family)
MKATLWIAGLATFVLPVWRQAPPAKQPSFEVVSIKPNNSLANGMGNRFDPELFSWTNVTLRVLIQQTYRVRDYQIQGAPNWVNSDRWDITAKSDGPTTFDQKNEMDKTLLRERFEMEFHRETKELPMYSLVALRNGPRFQEPNLDDLPASLEIGTGLISGHKWDVSSFAGILSAQINTPVLDKAGLKGIFDFKLEWTPIPNEGDFSSRNDSNDPSPTAPSGPTIFTAIQEQLGLKLESTKGPIEVLVIDSVRKPSEN